MNEENLDIIQINIHAKSIFRKNFTGLIETGICKRASLSISRLAFAIGVYRKIEQDIDTALFCWSTAQLKLLEQKALS
jgi:hypothetical protein